jgi:hypothetical protein
VAKAKLEPKDTKKRDLPPMIGAAVAKETRATPGSIALEIPLRKLRRPAADD